MLLVVIVDFCETDPEVAVASRRVRLMRVNCLKGLVQDGSALCRVASEQNLVLGFLNPGVSVMRILSYYDVLNPNLAFSDQPIVEGHFFVDQWARVEGGSVLGVFKEERDESVLKLDRSFPDLGKITDERDRLERAVEGFLGALEITKLT